MRPISYLSSVWMMVWLVNLGSGAEPNAAREPLAAWQSGVTVRPASMVAARHSIHAYFNATPESPDGTRVLFYVSTTAEGHTGRLCIIERASGKELTIARDITVEDAHRAACQHWISGGRRVVFHNVHGHQWRVAVIDIDTLQERVLVRDRQLGWGPAGGDVVPVYGCHWNPGTHRDLELVNVETGAVRTAATATDAQKTYPQEVSKLFGDHTVSVFFPIVSPDGRRVFFKLAAGSGGSDFRSSKASFRAGLFCYDLAAARFLFMRDKWGHPSWHADSRSIFEVGGLLIDGQDGATRKLPGLPAFPGSHPTVSPDGRLFATDTALDSLGGERGQWGLVVGSMTGQDYTIVHRFDQTGGARSWRRSHPHPAFSADGRRIYFNVSSGPWTRLLVAETPAGKP